MSDFSRIAERLADRYRIERELGRGAMATVFLARDLRHDRDVAIKVMHDELAASLSRQRFLREIRLAAKLAHPHILPLHDSGDAEGMLFYVMPNAEGRSLRDKMNAGPIAVADAVRVTIEVADALDFAHRHGIVHRDIKPENIVLLDGHAMVADFGIGKAMTEAVEDTLTQGGTSIGTPAYMSPEQAVGEDVDGRSDLYSLGCVLFEMLVGEPPFTGPNAQAVLAKRFVQTPIDVSALREGIPRPVAHAVQRVLQRTAIDRFASGAEFAGALRISETPEAMALGRPALPEKSIAVLPFANISTDPENECFADGITEEILNTLSQIADLRVAGRMSSFAFKEKGRDLREIGKVLNVRTVLEGSVRRSAGRVRITAQLTDVIGGYQLWSERFDRDIADVFAVQDEIATAIASKLKTSLASDDASRAQRTTESIEAYEAYLKGRALVTQRGNAMLKGIASLETSLQHDPDHGLTWSCLADAYLMSGFWGLVTLDVARAKCTEAVANAMHYAPDLAESHCSRAQYSLLYDWDWSAAESAFQQSLKLNPGYTQASAWYHMFYLGFVRGEYRAAAAGFAETLAQDPYWANGAAMLAQTFAFAQDAAAADVWATRAEELAPTAFFSHWTRQITSIAEHDWSRAIRAGSEALRLSRGALAFPLAFLGISLAEAGDRVGARAIYDEFDAGAAGGPDSSALRAMLAAALGKDDVASELCRDAVRRRDPTLVPFLRPFPGTRRLQALPEFRRVVASLGLPGLPVAGP
jgi:serine/threonine-protein kinase